MSKSISSMYVSLGGSIAGLSKTFNAAITPIQGLSRGIASASGALAGFATKIGTLAVAAAPIIAIGASVAGIKNAFASLDDIAKLSDRLGMTTQSIAGLQFAADLAGVSAEQLTGGFEKMLKTIAS